MCIPDALLLFRHHSPGISSIELDLKYQKHKGSIDSNAMMLDLSANACAAILLCLGVQFRQLLVVELILHAAGDCRTTRLSWHASVLQHLCLDCLCLTLTVSVSHCLCLTLPLSHTASVSTVSVSHCLRLNCLCFTLHSSHTASVSHCLCLTLPASHAACVCASPQIHCSLDFKRACRPLCISTCC